jgi:hypothetical protein
MRHQTSQRRDDWDRCHLGGPGSVSVGAQPLVQDSEASARLRAAETAAVPVVAASFVTTDIRRCNRLLALSMMLACWLMRLDDALSQALVFWLSSPASDPF